MLFPTTPFKLYGLIYLLFIAIRKMQPLINLTIQQTTFLVKGSQNKGTYIQDFFFKLAFSISQPAHIHRKERGWTISCLQKTSMLTFLAASCSIHLLTIATIMTPVRWEKREGSKRGIGFCML